MKDGDYIPRLTNGQRIKGKPGALWRRIVGGL